MGHTESQIESGICTCSTIIITINGAEKSAFQTKAGEDCPPCTTSFDGGVGVNTGEILFDSSFDDKLCQKEIISLTYLNNSNLANKITSTFSKFNPNDINLTFRTADLPYPTQVGKTDIHAKEIENPPFAEPIYNINITFDTDYLETATDLAIATTAIHEQVHAFLVYLHETGSLQANSTEPGYQELMQAYALHQQNNDDVALATTQHEYMASMVNEMTDDLYAYAQLNNIQGVDKEYCKRLIWGGLDETQTFKTNFPEFSPNSNIPNPEHLLIINSTNAEAKNETKPFTDHPDGNDYTVSPKGTPCNN